MTRFALALFALLALLGGCGQSALHLRGSNPDLGPNPNPNPSGTDLALPTGDGGVGSGCTTGADCRSGVCFTQDPFAGGYCSAHIGECPAPNATGTPWNPCPDQSVCINPGFAATGGSDYCLARCTTGADCRVAEGYACCPWTRGTTTVGVCARAWPGGGCM